MKAEAEPIPFVNRAVDRLRPVVPRSLRPPLRHLWRSFEKGLRYERGKRILRRYSGHYRTARRVYRNAGHRSAPLVTFPSDVGVQIVAPGRSNNIIDLPEQYLPLVYRVAAAVDERFRYSENCRVVAGLLPETIPVLMRDTHAIQDGEVISQQLLNPFDIAGLADLCEPIVQQLEHRVYASHVLLDKLYLYRSPICRAAPRKSWTWHYDNHPREVLKVMIYLTDVTAESAPFEYLRASSSGEPIRGRPLAPLYGTSRVPASTVERHLKSGAESCMVTGPAGTMVVFDDNVVHRGNLAKEQHRDVLVLQVRPATFHPVPRVDRRWTGSFGDVDFNASPQEVTPRRKG